AGIGKVASRQRSGVGAEEARVEIGVAPEQRVFRGDLIVRSKTPLVVIAIGALGRDKVAAGHVSVGDGRVLDEFLGHAGKAVRRDPIPWKGSAGRRIKYGGGVRGGIALGRGQSRQIAGELIGRGDQRRQRVAAAAAQRFPVSEEKQLVLDDRSSRGDAVLILAKWRLHVAEVVVEKVGRIELVVSNKFI